MQKHHLIKGQELCPLVDIFPLSLCLVCAPFLMLVGREVRCAFYLALNVLTMAKGTKLKCLVFWGFFFIPKRLIPTLRSYGSISELGIKECKNSFLSTFLSSSQNYFLGGRSRGMLHINLT